MCTWQPIETAPKDGTNIDLYVYSTWEKGVQLYRSTDCYWDSEKGWVYLEDSTKIISVESQTVKAVYWKVINVPSVYNLYVLLEDLVDMKRRIKISLSKDGTGLVEYIDQTTDNPSR